MMRKLSSYKAICLFILLSTIGQKSLADTPEPQPPIQIRTIAVSPYGIQSDDKQIANKQSGIYYELANELGNFINKHDKITINHQIYPYARIIHELTTGQTDISILFKYKELENYVTYIAPLPSLKNVVMGLNGTEFKDIKQLEGRRIAYLRGAKFSDEIDNNHKILKVTTKDFLQGIEMLSAKRADAIIGPLVPIIAAAQQLKKTDDFFSQPLIVSTRTPWLQMSNKSSFIATVDKIRAYYLQIASTEKLKQLKQKYLLDSRHFID